MAIFMRDDSLPHQIRLSFRPGTETGTKHIAVSCTCLATGRVNVAGPEYQPIAARDRWNDPSEPIRIWREHLNGKEGIASD